MNNIRWDEMKDDIFPNLTRPPKHYVPPALYRSNLNNIKDKDRDGNKL